jgi:CSLREA domain-containing protein
MISHPTRSILRQGVRLVVSAVAAWALLGCTPAGDENQASQTEAGQDASVSIRTVMPRQAEVAEILAAIRCIVVRVTGPDLAEVIEATDPSPVVDGVLNITLNVPVGAARVFEAEAFRDTTPCLTGVAVTNLNTMLFRGEESANIPGPGTTVTVQMVRLDEPVIRRLVQPDNNEGDVITVPIVAGDPNGVPLTFSATGLPLGLRIDPVTGQINGTLTNAAEGIHEVTVAASNGRQTARTAFTWTVTNPPPVAVNDAAATNEDTAVLINILANDRDPDNDVLTMRLASGPGNGTAVVNADGSLTYTPNANFNGVDSVTYQVNDGTVDSNLATVTMTINPVNDPPGFTPGPDPTVLEDAGAQTVPAWATAISPGPPNEATQTLTFLVTNNNNALFAVQPAVAPDGTLTYTPALEANGNATVTVQLQDDGGTANGGLDTSPPQVFIITVLPVNDPPGFTRGPNLFVFESTGAQTVPAWATAISPGPPDEATQTLTFLVTNNNNALFAVQPAVAPDGTLTYTPALEANGNATVTVQLQDDGGTANGGLDTSLLEVFIITVLPPILAVDSTGDDPDANTSDLVCATSTEACTLRAAIEQANAAGPGVAAIGIVFDIPGAGPHTIQPTTALPTITIPVIIDGYTQPGASLNTLPDGNNALLLVELDGSSAGPGANGLTISAGESTVRGLVINRFAANGIAMLTAGNNVIAGNFIGTDTTGTVALGNGDNGVFIEDVSNNIIGGITPEMRNVISGNVGDGIDIMQVNGVSTSNLVQGNFLGTDRTGTNPLGNGDDGIELNGVSNTIGGILAGARNVISGNGFNGIAIFNATASNNLVQGNLIGTDVTGTGRLGNSNDGVLIDSAPGNTIGGTLAGAQNVISSNGRYGVGIFDPEANGNGIQGNFIGTDITGTADLGNGAGGVAIFNNATNNTIGGTDVGMGNTIAFNATPGVLVASGTGNAILSNQIFSNVSAGAETDFGQGIDLGVTGANVGNGVTANDQGDADTGPNNLQNFPVLTPAFTDTDSDTTFINGTLNSTPNTDFRLQFFANAVCTELLRGQGEVFLVEIVVNTGSSGTVDIDFSRAGAVAVGQFITATATDPAGNTSEFSPCTPVLSVVE